MSARSEGAGPALDEGRAVRAEDALPIDALMSVLQAALPGLDGPPELRQFPGGASNLTYLLRWPDRELVLRRPPRGRRVGAAHDMVREARILRALRPHFPLVPEVLLVCEDEGPLGAPFFVMERLRGLILREDIPPGVADTPEAQSALCGGVLDALSALHAVDVEATGLAALVKGPGYARRQIDGWSARWRAARTEGAPDAERVMAWLDAHCPEDSAQRLIHGDYRFDNVMLSPTAPHPVIGVLDWEMATVGCPLMDWGASLAYWVEAEDDLVMHMMRRQPTQLPGMPTRAQIWARVGERRGAPVDDPQVYEIYGLFRLAAILQQIWARVVAGHTRNPAFAAFGDSAAYLILRCEGLLDARGDR